MDLGKPQVKHRVLSLEPKINKYNVMAANQSSQPLSFGYGDHHREARKAMRILLSLMIVIPLAPIAVAQAPATSNDSGTAIQRRDFPGESLREPLREAFPGLEVPPGLDVKSLYNLDIINEAGESLTTLHAIKLCHVANLSKSQAIVQTCQNKDKISKQVADWKKFVVDVRSNPTAMWASTLPLQPAGSKLYLIDSGRTFESLTGQSPSRPVAFDPPCKFPVIPNGANVAKLCSKSIARIPFAAEIEGDSIVLNRLQKEPTQAFVALTKKTEEAVIDAQKEAPRRVLINLLETEKPCIFEGRTVAHGQTRTRFSASKAPVGQRCEKLVRRCENGVMSGDDAFRFLTCSDTQACDFDKKKVKDKGTIDAYKLNVVDSSTGRKCSEPTNMMRLTCTNGQLSGPNEFRFSTCTARPMPGCNVIDRTKPGGYRTIPHGDTGEVFTSATAPSGSSCASVKKTAQCLNGRMFVDGVATAVFTPFFTDCTDRAPGGPGGNVNPGLDCSPVARPVELPDGTVETVWEPDPKCNGQQQQGTAESCDNGIDDDGDLAVDCDDGDCRDKVECIDDEPHPDECGGTDAERCELVNKQIASFQAEWRNKKATMPFTLFVKELLAACAESSKSWKECCPTATMPARGEVTCSQLPTETEPVG